MCVSSQPNEADADYQGDCVSEWAFDLLCLGNSGSDSDPALPQHPFFPQPIVSFLATLTWVARTLWFDDVLFEESIHFQEFFSLIADMTDNS